MKNIFTFIAVSLFIASLVGCGPKNASQEQLTKLSEIKASCETMEAQLKDLQSERAKLEQEKLEKQQTKNKLQAEYQQLESAANAPASGEKGGK